MVDGDLLKETIEIFLFLSTDNLNKESSNSIKDLEKKIIERTQQFYRSQCEKYLGQVSLSEYLQHADRFYTEEL